MAELKKGAFMKGGLRIPAILEWPARFSPKEIDTPCVSSDLYPTLLGIAGVKRGKGHPPLDGTDIIPIISGRKKKSGQPLDSGMDSETANRHGMTESLKPS
ncbi:MAG: hypothetical protein CM15mP130_2540 [Verrucomicrobiota bacterium]|nr:MAG: hypothetical protein CM15mP130_2540 [Verrucomicrobiota bacterium]